MPNQKSVTIRGKVVHLRIGMDRIEITINTTKQPPIDLLQVLEMHKVVTLSISAKQGDEENDPAWEEADYDNWAQEEEEL